MVPGAARSAQGEASPVQAVEMPFEAGRSASGSPGRSRAAGVVVAEVDAVGAGAPASAVDASSRPGTTVAVHPSPDVEPDTVDRWVRRAGPR